MANIYKGAIELIGNTPLVEVVNLEQHHDLKATVLVKLEYLNPAGSVKDRIAKAMLEDAEEKGLLKNQENHLVTTEAGMFLSDGIASDLFML